MQQAPVFEKSLLEQRSNLLHLDAWPQVMKTYDEKRYRDAMMALLEYVNKEQVEKYGNADKTHFEFAHGSIKLYVDVSDEEFSVRAPFLKVGDKNVIPFLRQITEINFNTLVLPRIVLEDNVLEFRFSSPIDGAFPYKLYDLFKNICHTADNFDDFFIDKFGVERAEEMKTEAFPAELLDTAYEKFQQYLKETLEYAVDLESKRSYTFAKEMMLLQLQKIDYYMRPQGYLKGELEMIVKTLKAQAPDVQKIADAKPMIEKLLELPKEKFAESMYKVEIFLPEGGKMDMNGVKEYFKRTVEDAKKDLSARSYLGAYLILAGDIASLFFYKDLPAEAYEKLENILVEAGGKEWQQASEGLLKGIEEIMNS